MSKSQVGEKHSKLYLHEAMTLVLKRYGDKGLRPQDLADIIFNERLYLTQSGSKADINQIYARRAKYPHIFDLVNGIVKLR